MLVIWVFSWALGLFVNADSDGHGVKRKQEWILTKGRELFQGLRGTASSSWTAMKQKKQAQIVTAIPIPSDMPSDLPSNLEYKDLGRDLESVMNMRDERC